MNATFAAIKFDIDEKGKASDPQMISDAENKKTIKLHLWDTAGDDKLRNLTKHYFQGASAAVVVYDVTCRDSLDTA